MRQSLAMAAPLWLEKLSVVECRWQRSTRYRRLALDQEQGLCQLETTQARKAKLGNARSVPAKVLTPTETVLRVRLHSKTSAEELASPGHAAAMFAIAPGFTRADQLQPPLGEREPGPRFGRENWDEPKRNDGRAIENLPSFGVRVSRDGSLGLSNTAE